MELADPQRPCPVVVLKLSWNFPIVEDETKILPVWDLYRDWLCQRKISKKFWRARLDECWRYRGPIALDETHEWPM